MKFVRIKCLPTFFFRMIINLLILYDKIILFKFKFMKCFISNKILNVFS